MTPADWPEVRKIYADGIATGDATLEREAPDWDHFEQLMEQALARVPALRPTALGTSVASPSAASATRYVALPRDSATPPERSTNSESPTSPLPRMQTNGRHKCYRKLS